MATKKSQSGIFGSIRKNKQLYLNKLVELHSQGLNDTQIAKELGISLRSANSWRKALNLEKNFEYKRKFDTKKFKELYEQGLNYSEIAKQLNSSNRAIQNYASSLGLSSNYNKYEELNLTSEEFQVFLGTMYGDCSLSIPKEGANVRGHFAHSLAQENYCKWKYEKLQRLCSTPAYRQQTDKRSGKIYNSIDVVIKANPYFTKIYDKFYHTEIIDGRIKHIKYINRELFEKIEPLGLAVLFQDDGSYDHNGYSISTNCFSNEDIDIIIDVLKKKFDITFTKHSNNVIRVGVKGNKNKFIELIKPYIHKDCYYKLHLDPPKTPLNEETPKKDNLVLNPQEIEENAERLEVMPNE